MTWLGLLLAFKIVFTASAVVVPLWWSTSARLATRFGVAAFPTLVARLYGMALTALLVGYAGGWAQAEAGAFPHGVVAMGIVSNAGAAIILGASRPNAALRAGAVVFTAIAAGLVGSLLAPHAALARAW